MYYFGLPQPIQSISNPTQKVRTDTDLTSSQADKAGDVVTVKDFPLKHVVCN